MVLWVNLFSARRKALTNSGKCSAKPEELKDLRSEAASQIPGVKLFGSGFSGFSGEGAPQSTEFRKGISGISRAWKEGEQLIAARNVGLLRDVLCFLHSTYPQTPQSSDRDPLSLTQHFPDPRGAGGAWRHLQAPAGRAGCRLVLTDKEAAAKRNL